MIKCTVKDSKSSQVHKIHRVEYGIVNEYISKEEIEQVVQEECEVRFNLTFKVPIMKHALAKKLRYLEDENITETIVVGVYDIPTDLDETTK